MFLERQYILKTANLASTKQIPFGEISFKLVLNFANHCVQKVKFSIEDFFSKYDQIRRKLWIWSHLLKEFLMENFIFCTVSYAS